MRVWSGSLSARLGGSVLNPEDIQKMMQRNATNAIRSKIEGLQRDRCEYAPAWRVEE